MNRLSLSSLTPALCALIVLGAWVPSMPAGETGSSAPGSIAGVAEAEAAKRAEAARAADATIIEARELAARGEVTAALDRLAGVVSTLPESPFTLPTRAAARDAFCSIATEEASRLASEGRYDQAKALLERALAPEMDPDYQPARRLLADLADPVKFPPAASPELTAKVAAVEKALRLGESHLHLARYDQAKESFNEVLRLDPYNIAARQGMEQAERAIIEYAAPAYSHTRARLLREVAEKWEMENPERVAALARQAMQDGPAAEAAQQSQRRDLLVQKLRNTMIDSIAIEGVDIREALQTIIAKSRSADRDAPEGAPRGIDIVLRIGSPDEPFFQSVVTREINLRLANVPLEAVLKYAAEQAGLGVRVEPFAVVLVPPSSVNSEMFLRTYSVPPDFIATVPSAPEAGGSDPFAANAAASGGGLALRRLSPKEFLEQSGLTFPENAFVAYDARTSTVSMRNTAGNHEVLEAMVEQSRTNITPQVVIETKMVEVQEDVIRELGFDWLLAGFSLSDGVAAAGGTGADFLDNNGFPFTDPSGDPLGSNPITAGNRSGDTALTSRTMERLLDVRDTSKLAQATLRGPAPLAVGGVLTDPRFQMVIRALSQNKGTDFLNAPSVTTRSGLPARVEVVREFIYPTEFDPPELPNSVGSAGDGTFPVTPANPAAFDTTMVGSILEAEPVVSNDKNIVELNLDILHREFSGFVNYGTPITTVVGDDPDDKIIVTENRILQPIFETRSIKTSVSVYDGQTLTLGGILVDSAQLVNDTVPLLGDVPVLGRFFKSNVREQTRRVLMIFVTVHVLDPSGRPRSEALAVDTSQP